jgi:hypothetical protein
MDVTMSSNLENDYLFIEVQGNIVDSEEHKLLTKRFYNEIVKYDAQKIIVDVSKMTFPASLQFHNDIVKFYTEELPSRIRLWKIAVVDETNYREIGKYWQFKVNQSGFDKYEVFSSIEEARMFITGSSQKTHNTSRHSRQ